MSGSETTKATRGKRDPGNKRPTSHDLLNHALLAAPVFLLYHVGLLVSPEATNGADLFTRLFGDLAGRSTLAYLVCLVVLIGGYYVWVKRMMKRGKFQLSRFWPLVGEAALYALVMGPLANFLLSQIHVLGGASRAMGPVDGIVASAGAGFYEELVFRLMGIYAVSRLLKSIWPGLKIWQAVLFSVLTTSLLFSLAHYVGPGSDRLQLASFAFRFVLGVMLACIFLFRGFATAVWTHFLYDVYILCIVLG